MTEASLAIAAAVFAWWLSTGLVLILVRMSRRAAWLSALIASFAGAAALAGLSFSARHDDLAAVYGAFGCALLAWAWHELTFLCGWITGPRRTALPGGLSGWSRFVESLRAVLWHEIGIATIALLIIALTWDQPNQVGTGTFLVLWVMRASAKLNLFLGVRNLSEQFLPEHLGYLQSFFRRRRMNVFFPVAMALALFALAVIVDSALVPEASTSYAVGRALVATMLALAIVEHALLVLPLDTTAPWRWALARRERQDAGFPEPSMSSHESPQNPSKLRDEKFLHAR